MIFPAKFTAKFEFSEVEIARCVECKTNLTHQEPC